MLRGERVLPWRGRPVCGVLRVRPFTSPRGLVLAAVTSRLVAHELEHLLTVHEVIAQPAVFPSFERQCVSEVERPLCAG